MKKHLKRLSNEMRRTETYLADAVMQAKLANEHEVVDQLFEIKAAHELVRATAQRLEASYVE